MPRLGFDLRVHLLLCQKLCHDPSRNVFPNPLRRLCRSSRTWVDLPRTSAVVITDNPSSAAWCIELSPLALRPYCLIYVHVTNNIGQLLAAIMSQRYANRTDPMGWRIPYAIQWAFPLPLLIAAWFAPESPWWLIRRGKHEAAAKSLARLHNGEMDEEEVLALIQHTVNLERSLQFGGSYWDCFKGTNRRRTEIAFMAALALDLTGFGLKSVAYFLEAA